MPHSSGGYFYYRYTYHCPWRSNTGQTGTENTYHSAVYTPVLKEDHRAQSEWYKHTAMPAVKADIERNFYPDADRNKRGITYERYNEKYVTQEDFRYYSNLPVHTTGHLKGFPFGKEI